MLFTKKEISEAKKGRHYIRWSPDQNTSTVVVVKVRNQFVWVKDLNRGDLVRIGMMESVDLIKGAYR